METLEKRLAPAGIVTAVLTGGALQLTGDVQDNLLIVREMGPEFYEIEGVAGTLISLNGAGGVSAITLAGVSKSITITLKDGADDLALHDLSFDGKVAVNLGEGDNVLTLGQMDIGGSLSITAGKGNDTIVAGLDATSLRIAGLTTFALGDGDNEVNLTDRTEGMAGILDPQFAGPVIFGGALTYTGGSGADSVVVAADSILFGAGFTVKTGAGEGELLLGARHDLRVTGTATFLAMDHPGLTSKVSMGGENIAISGGLSVKHGAGLNVTSLIATDQISVGGTVAITNGNTPVIDFQAGNKIYLMAESLSVGGNLTVTDGTGKHLTRIDGAVVVDGAVTITNGKNSDPTATRTQINGPSLEVGAGLTIINKEGMAYTHIGSLRVEVAGKIAVTNLGTGTEAASAQVYTRIATLDDPTGTRLSAGAITITNGAGNFNTEISSAEVFIAGSVAIVNGHTTPAGGGFEAGETDNVLLGSWHVQGNVSLTNGNGRFSSAIDDLPLGTAEPHRFFAGGAVAITNGNVAMAYNSINVTHFHAKSLTLKSGHATAVDAIVNNIALEDLRVATALSITNGNTFSAASTDNVLNVIDALAIADLGSLTIKNGNGANQTDVVAPVLNIRGALSLASGKAGVGAANNFTFTIADRLTVGGATGLTTSDGATGLYIDAPDIHFGGKVSLTFGAGADQVQIGPFADSLFAAGGFVIKTNAGDSTVAIGGTGMDTLNVLGGITLTAGDGADTFSVRGDGRISGGVSASFGKGASASLTLSGQDTQTGLLYLGGGVSLGADAGTARSLYLHNTSLAGLTLTGGLQSDTLTLSDTRVRGALTADLLGGDDYVYLDDVLISGATTVKTGAGADGIYIESYTLFQGGSEFQGAVNFNMGADNDELWIVETDFPELSATFLSTATFDGGPSTNGNFLHQGPNLLFTTPPSLTNFPNP